MNQQFMIYWQELKYIYEELTCIDSNYYNEYLKKHSNERLINIIFKVSKKLFDSIEWKDKRRDKNIFIRNEYSRKI